MSIRALLALLASAATLLATEAAHATFPGRNGRLLVQRAVGDQVDLVTVRPDGTAEHRIGHSPLIEEKGTWSPDGRRVAFARGPANDDREEIFTMSAGGGDIRRVTSFGSTSTEPAWSPSGRRLVFFTLKDATGGDPPPSELYSIGTDGRASRRLTHDGAIETDPTWSPGGGRILFTAWRAVPGLPGEFDNTLAVVPANGGQVRLLLPFSAKRDALNPNWSPDGRRIVFELIGPQPGHRSRRESDLAILDLTSGRIRRITSTAAEESNPVWSPDGRSIAFASDRSAGGYHADPVYDSFELYVMPAGSGAARRLTHNHTYENNPDWQAVPRVRAG